VFSHGAEEAPIPFLPFRKSVPAVHFPNFSVYSYIS
jgi:hypothetical protein